MTVGERMRKFAEQVFGSITNFERAMGSGGFHKYFKGERYPGFGIMEKMYNLGCSTDWLIVGEGPMFANNETGRKLHKKFVSAGAVDIDVVSEPASGYKVPLYLAPFEDEASVEDGEGSTVDLNRFLMPSRDAAFLVRVTSDNMKHAGIIYGDVLVTDKDIEPQPGNIVVASVQGGTVIKRWEWLGGKSYLMSEDGSHKPISVSEGDEGVKVLGVVRSIVRQVLPGASGFGNL